MSGAEANAKETTPLEFGRPVRCSDGPVGSLSDVVIDPTERRVSHIVVETPNGAARLVPAELLDTAQGTGDDIVLSCSVADVLDRGTIRTFSYVGSGAFPQNDDSSDVGVEDLQALPEFGGAELGEFAADLWGNYTVTYDRIPPGAAELRRDSIAVTGGGDEIGTIDGFLVTGMRLTHVVLQPGETRIPIDSVTAIETDHITVSLP